jgi:hypothetical protein
MSTPFSLSTAPNNVNAPRSARTEGVRIRPMDENPYKAPQERGGADWPAQKLWPFWRLLIVLLAIAVGVVVTLSLIVLAEKWGHPLVLGQPIRCA